MSIALSKHTLPELETLLAEVKQAIAERENMAEQAAALPATAEGASTALPPLADASSQARPEPAEPPAEPIPEPAPTPVIRYVHPASRTLTWTGEGDVPEWITAYLTHGGSWSAMENAAEKLAASRRLSHRLSPVGAAPHTSKK